MVEPVGKAGVRRRDSQRGDVFTSALLETHQAAPPVVAAGRQVVHGSHAQLAAAVTSSSVSASSFLATDRCTEKRAKQ